MGGTMGKNSKERRESAIDQAQKFIQNMGPKNVNWRNTFLRLWQETTTTDLKIHSVESQIRDFKVQLITLKDSEKDKKVGMQDGIKTLQMSRDLDAIQRMVFRDHLLQHLGREWTIKKVWESLNELERAQTDLFEKSKGGE